MSVTTLSLARCSRQTKATGMLRFLMTERWRVYVQINECRYLVKVGAFAWYSVKICVIFLCPVWKTKSWLKSKPTRQLKHANSILEYFEYFCQMSSKSILIILSYTVSKLVRFFLRHSVDEWNDHRYLVISKMQQTNKSDGNAEVFNDRTVKPSGQNVE